MSSRRKQSNPRSLKADVEAADTSLLDVEIVVDDVGEISDANRSDESDLDGESKDDDRCFLDDRRSDAAAGVERNEGSTDSVSPEQENTLTDDDKESMMDKEIPYSNSISKQYPYACAFCDKTFSKFSHVKDHEMLHSSEMPYQCEFCQRPFRHKRSRDRHMKLHTGDKNYKCALCDAAFSSLINCRQCSATCLNCDDVSLHCRSDHLKNHMKSHSNGRWLPSAQVKQAVSPMGGKSLSVETASTDKIQTTVSGSSGSQPPQQCQLCHATFTNYYELDEHVKAHASQQQTVSGGIPTTNPILPVKPLEYHCTHCAKQSLKQVFASLPALEQHVTHMHTGKGLSLLSCPHCEAGFPTVPTLNDHIGQEHKHKKTSTGNMENGVASARCSSQSNVISKTAVGHMRSSDAAAASPGSRSVGSADFVLCTLCKKPFTSAAEMIGHMMQEHGSASGSSQIASPNRATNQLPSPAQSYERDNPTPLDLSSRSPSTSPLVCQICGDNFSSMLLLIEHNQKRHWELLKSKCNVCSEVVSSPQDHLDHMERHYLSTRRHFSCRCCKQTFSLVDELQAHLVAEHSRKIYKCLLCSDLFHTDVDLKIHLTVEHSNENKSYRCACCGQDFDNITAWKAHMLHSHMDLILPACLSAGMGVEQPPKHKCAYCVSTFRTEAELNIHVLTHQKAFQCVLCDERFAVEYLRDKHMQNEHSRHQVKENLSLRSPTGTNQIGMEASAPYWCSICERIFHSEDVYEEHKRKSHSSVKSWPNGSRSGETTLNNTTQGNMQTKMFSTACSTCGKAFKTYSELDKHSRIHFGSVSLTCIICDQVFSSLADMAKHKLQHCKVQCTKPCILCHTEVTDAESYQKHAHLHIESDSTTVCCVCKHRITSQVELDLHAEHHFPKKQTLSCASCKKPCPYFIQLPSQLTENPQFLLCQDCLMSRKQSTSIILPSRLMQVPPLTPEESRSPHSPPTRLSSSSTPPSYTREAKNSSSSLHTASPPTTHRCNECSVKFESIEDLENHGCMKKPCNTCLKTFKISELVCKLDSYICSSCDSIPKDLWKCDKCKLTFTREEKYQKHNCVALGDGKACKMCQGRFNHSQLLLRGNRLVCKSCDKKLSTCSVCSETYVVNEGHMCRLQCEVCREMFNSSNARAGKPALCNLCLDRQTSDVDSGGSRSQRVSSSDKVYQCIKCQKMCDSESEIKVHILTYHMNDKTHKCYLCSALFSTPAKLQTHLIEHNFSFSDRMNCPKCDWVTSDSSALMNHCVSEHSVTNRNFVCAYCLQSFFFETELINHSACHHNGINAAHPQATGEYSRKRSCSPDQSGPRVKAIKSEAFSDVEDELFCSRCDVEFASLDQYNNHINIHHKDTMTKCHQCLRLYCCKDDLTEHINTCSPEKRRFSDYDLFRGRNMAMLSPAKLAGSSALDNYGSAYRRHTIESTLSKDERLNSERMVRSPSISTK